MVSKMAILEHFGEGCLLQPPAPPERTEFSLDPTSNGDEEGTTSGGTSGDDIWGTPTSGGPDDESFTGSPVSIVRIVHAMVHILYTCIAACVDDRRARWYTYIELDY